jgi:hypothetical protein
LEPGAEGAGGGTFSVDVLAMVSGRGLEEEVLLGGREEVVPVG